MRLSETEVCARAGQISVRRLRLWVRNGWLLPSGSENGPVFDEVDLARVRLVCQLKDDLNLNDDAVPVVLSLIDQLHGLRAELRALAEALECQPQEVRREVRQNVREMRRRS